MSHFERLGTMREMRIVMKTHFWVIGTMAVIGTSFVSTSFALNTSDYLHLTRHRDSTGKLLMGPTEHQSEPSVMQKTMMPAQPKTFERRSTDWGMSAQDVKAHEPIQPSWELQSPILTEHEQRVAYHTQIEGIEAALTYTFYDNHLGQAKYVFEPQHEDVVEYVQDFQDVKNWISQSYGVPTSVQEIWLDTLYQYDKTLWGQAILRGHLVMVAEWQKAGTDIVLVLDGGNDTVGLVADFTSTTFAVPVSLVMQSHGEQVEASIEETTNQDVLQTETFIEPSVEDVSGQELSSQMGSSGEFHPEIEVASQGPVNEVDDLKEIEQMLNEEFPVSESVEPSKEVEAMDSSMHEPMPETEVASQGPVDDLKEIEQMLNEDSPLNESVEPAMEGDSLDNRMDGVQEKTAIEADLDAHAPVNSEAYYPEFVEENPVVERHIMDKGMSNDSPIEASADVQAQEKTMDLSEAMPVESAIEEGRTEADSIQDYAAEHQVDEQGDGLATEAEPELEPQHL